MVLNTFRPAPPRQRFPRNRYIRQLLELEREMREWQGWYAEQGIGNREDVCSDVRVLVHQATETLMQLKSK